MENEVDIGFLEPVRKYTPPAVEAPIPSSEQVTGRTRNNPVAQVAREQEFDPRIMGDDVEKRKLLKNDEKRLTLRATFEMTMTPRRSKLFSSSMNPFSEPVVQEESLEDVQKRQREGFELGKEGLTLFKGEFLKCKEG